MSLELLLRAGGWAALGAAVYGLILAVPTLGRMAAGGRVFRADRRGQALAVGLMLASLPWGSDVGPDRPTLYLATILFAWAFALRLTDLSERLLIYRPLAVAILLLMWALIVHAQPPLASLKVPFAAEVRALGLVGWVVSWVWLVLFGSLFARAGTSVGVAPGLAIISGVTFLAIGVLRPDLMPPHGFAFAAALTGAGLGLAPLERYLFHRSSTAGAYAVGVAVGWVAAACLVKNTALLALLLPLLMLGMPLFAAVAPAAAQRRRRVVERPGHLHEVLLAQGYSQRQVTGVQLVGASYLALLAVLLVAIVEAHWAIKLAVVVAWVVAGLFCGYVVVRLLPRAVAHHGPAELRLFGLRLHALTMAEAMELARGFLRSGEPHYIVTCDAAGLVRAREDEEFRQIVNHADLVTADGAGVVLAAKLLGLPVEVRVSGCDMVENLCRIAAEEGQTVFFLGAEPGVAEQAAARIAERTPGLQVAGVRDGYFRSDEEPAVVAELAALSPGVLFVALGQPRQERFLRDHLAEIGARVAIGIGGSLDVLSGRKRRAPVWMQRTGLEWAYRVCKEPTRLPRLKALPRVVFMAFGELLRGPSAPDDEE